MILSRFDGQKASGRSNRKNRYRKALKMLLAGKKNIREFTEL